MPQHLTSEQRYLVIHLHKAGISQRKIASEVGCSKTGVNTTIKRWLETDGLEERPGRGRKRATTVRQDRTLVRLSMGNRRLTSTDLCREWKESADVDVAPSTVRTRLLENGLRGCKARRKPKVNEKQRKARLTWAREHLTWTEEQWAKVLFSDESTFTIQNHAGNNYVRRRTTEEFSPQCILPTIKHPTSVMVWGCMAASGIGRLHICEGMMNATKYKDVLQTKMLPSARTLFQMDDWMFQDDNAPCHRARLVKRWMEENEVRTINWPAQSPDLNPIENLWQRMSCIIAKDKPTNKRMLIEKIIRAWHHIVTAEELQNLVSSMPRRCQAVIKNKGWPTKY